jgi:hypothetical protein
VYVRATDEPLSGLEALRSKGAILWPNPQDTDAFEGVFDVAMSALVISPQSDLELLSSDILSDITLTPSVVQVSPPAIEALTESVQLPVTAPIEDSVDSTTQVLLATQLSEAEPDVICLKMKTVPTVDDILFVTVREVIQQLLRTPMKDAEVAAKLDVNITQAKLWLKRLLEEDFIEKQKKPAGYVVKQKRLFE